MSRLIELLQARLSRKIARNDVSICLASTETSLAAAYPRIFQTDQCRQNRVGWFLQSCGFVPGCDGHARDIPDKEVETGIQDEEAKVLQLRNHAERINLRITFPNIRAISLRRFGEVFHNLVKSQQNTLVQSVTLTGFKMPKPYIILPIFPGNRHADI